MFIAILVYFVYFKFKTRVISILFVLQFLRWLMHPYLVYNRSNIMLV